MSSEAPHASDQAAPVPGAADATPFGAVTAAATPDSGRTPDATPTEARSSDQRSPGAAAADATPASRQPAAEPPGRRLFTGWGRTAPTAATPRRPRGVEELAELLRDPGPRGLIARGLGRSYGDAAQCAGGQVVECAALSGHHLDPVAHTVTAGAGTSLDALMRALLPRGYFLPVTPGTRHVTVGGAIAADIHGKNHHADSSFGAHLREIALLTPDGRHRHLTPHDDAELFWATVGGMGLTGVVTEATFAVPEVRTAWMRVDTDRTPNLEATLAAMTASDADYRHSVAWIDLLARGASLGRGVLTRAHHAEPEELSPRQRRAPLAFAPRVHAGVPPGIPPGLLNTASVRAFNTAYYHRAPRRRRDEIQDLAGFFHPLDVLRDWNRLYGPRGLVQYQFVVPFGAEDTLRRIVTRLAALRAPAFLAVLKRFGPGVPAPLSFPRPGWTLALDLPADVDGLAAVLTHFDTWVAEAGGRIYLAKDSRAAAATVARMYDDLPRWRAVRERVDPERVLRSDLARRLGL